MTKTKPIPATRSTTPVTGRRVPLILSIDDDPDIARTIEIRLREYDVRVKQALFGIQGFWEAIRELPDLILLDMVMPQGNGQFVLECLKNNRHSEDIPVIMLSGRRDHGLRNRAFELGAAQFLQKPVAFEELLQEMRVFVDIREHAEPAEQEGNAAGDDGAAALAEGGQITKLVRHDLGRRGAP